MVCFQNSYAIVLKDSELSYFSQDVSQLSMFDFHLFNFIWQAAVCRNAKNQMTLDSDT